MAWRYLTAFQFIDPIAFFTQNQHSNWFQTFDIYIVAIRVQVGCFYKNTFKFTIKNLLNYILTSPMTWIIPSLFSLGDFGCFGCLKCLITKTRHDNMLLCASSNRQFNTIEGIKPKFVKLSISLYATWYKNTTIHQQNNRCIVWNVSKSSDCFNSQNNWRGRLCLIQAFSTTWKMTQKCEGPTLKVILSGVSFVTCGQ